MDVDQLIADLGPVSAKARFNGLRFPILNLCVGAALSLTACGGDTGSDEDSGTEGGLTVSGVTGDNSAGTDTDASTSDATSATTMTSTTMSTTVTSGDGDGDVETGDGDVEPLCVPILGDCSHVPDGLVIETVLSAADGLSSPTDCEFKPEGNDELWVTNRADYSMVIVQNTMQGSQTSFRVQENFGGGAHFKVQLKHPEHPAPAADVDDAAVLTSKLAALDEEFEQQLAELKARFARRRAALVGGGNDEARGGDGGSGGNVRGGGGTQCCGGINVWARCARRGESRPRRAQLGA